MSLYILATGKLVADPVRRVGAKGDYVTVMLRASTDDGGILVGAIAFASLAEELLTHGQGAAIAISGRGRLSEWTDRNGNPQHGLSLTVEQIASVSAARRADADRRRVARGDARLPRVPPRRTVGDVAAGDG